MPVDISRVRLDPLLDFAGVTLKQGGLLLDADVNELGDILDRRLRALASDVLGRATVSSTTPDAFKLAVAGGGLTIGTGRLYVDGLLAECHGAPSTVAAKRLFNPLMAEPAFVDPVAYTAQPYLPQPPALPESGRHLVYLDVWHREVSHLERPDLVESAIGIEATGRTQTVWQVRVLDGDAANATCSSADDDLPGWSALTSPSGARLTTGTYEVAPIDDPCQLPPTGGYRGLENQTFRVEIHDGGLPGAGASFVWSREAASVGARVTDLIGAGEVELATLGRDDLLSIKTGDWVEIIDDAREFAHLAGEIRKVTVDEATRRLRFTPDLPAAMLPAAFPDEAFPAARNLRVRRWDQAGKVYRTASGGNPVEVQDLDVAGGAGVIDVPAAGVTLLLENGVTVAFDVADGAAFRPGDHWIFAARTADASVELLDRAPPRGIHHHYARLGLWDVGTGTVADCRHPWPPATGEADDCSCTACVTAVSHASGQFTIQDAVNQAAQTGGTVCLGPGTYALAEPVRLTGLRSIRLRGQGPATVLAAPAGAIAIEKGMAIAVERLAILSLARCPAITVATAIGLRLSELVIVVIANSDFRASAIALSGIVAAAAIVDNAILAPTAILANDPTLQPPPGNVANLPPSLLITAALRIEDNILWSQRQAVVLGGRVAHLAETRIAGNTVLACTGVAISTLGLGLPGSSMAVRGNTLSVAGSGIACGVDGAGIADNKLTNTAPDDERAAAVGITLAAGLDRDGPNEGQVLANQIAGFGRAGIQIAAPTGTLIVSHNIIEQCGNGILSTDDAQAGALVVEGNQLRDIGFADRAGAAIVVGIGVARAGMATVAHNVIRSLGTGALRSSLRAGIMAVGVGRARVAGNDIADLAPPGDYVGQAIGILLLGPLADFEVTGNRVERESVAAATAGNGVWSSLRVLDRATANEPFQIAGALAAVPVDAARTLTFGLGRPILSTGTLDAATGQQVGAKGSVLGNVLVARGNAPAVQITAGTCLVNDNRVDALFNGRVAVQIAAPVVTVGTNRVTGGELSIQITVATAKSAAVLGNITTGPISLAGAGLSAPWDALNLRA